jgi:hypothetical protein
LLGDAWAVRADLEALGDALGRLVAGDGAEGVAAETPEDALARTLRETDRIVEMVRAMLETAPLGLPPVDIEVDDAMMTALIQRYDLMNERGRLADDRRNIKLAADDLKTVLDLDASHSIRTRDNKAVKFTSKNSETRLALSIDLPFNRLAQRNTYRQAVIDYQAGRRSLMALEDGIKFDVRDGLRQLDETRIQYPISVTQAALAAEQVVSVQLQLSLGVEGVRGTDLLDALQSSREALIRVANARIGYIVDRAGLVLDLELMALDENGAWPRVNDPDYRPEPDLVYPANAGPTYGEIPRYLLVSSEIRRSLERPLPGVAPEAPGAGDGGGGEVVAGEPESGEAMAGGAGRDGDGAGAPGG